MEDCKYCPKPEDRIAFSKPRATEANKSEIPKAELRNMGSNILPAANVNKAFIKITVESF